MSILQAVETEVKAVQAILEALKGSNKPFVITSGSAGVGLTSGPVDETHPMSPEFGQSRGLAEVLMRKVHIPVISNAEKSMQVLG